MTVAAVGKIKTQTSKGKGGYHRDYRSLYQVTTDDVTDSPITIVEQTRTPGSLYLPQIGDYYSWHGDIDLYAFVTDQPDVTPRDVRGTRKLWDVMISHSTHSTKRDNATQFANPLDEPWTVNRVADEWTEEAERDSVTGKQIANSAHQLYTGKQVELIRVRGGWELEKNFPLLDLDLIESTEGHTNSSSVTLRGRSYPARHLFLRPITVQELHNKHVGFYYKHKFKIDTRENGFDVTFVDRGTKYLAGTDKTNPQHFTDILDPVTGNPIAAPGVPLDGNGARLSAAAIDAGNLATRTFAKEPTAELNFWGFPP